MRQKNSSALAATSDPSHTVLDRLESNTITMLEEVKLNDIVVESFGGPLIKPGEYEVQYTHHETHVAFGTPKVFVHFQIVSVGPAHGTRLYRAFRVSELIGKPGKNGRFKLKKRNELILELCRLYQSEGLRPDRVSLRPLKNIILKVKVRTVIKDYRQKPLPEVMQYSVIGEFISIEAGVLST